MECFSRGAHNSVLVSIVLAPHRVIMQRTVDLEKVAWAIPFMLIEYHAVDHARKEKTPLRARQLLVDRVEIDNGAEGYIRIHEVGWEDRTSCHEERFLLSRFEQRHGSVDILYRIRPIERHPIQSTMLHTHSQVVSCDCLCASLVRRIVTCIAGRCLRPIRMQVNQVDYNPLEAIAVESVMTSGMEKKELLNLRPVLRRSFHRQSLEKHLREGLDRLVQERVVFDCFGIHVNQVEELRPLLPNQQVVDRFLIDTTKVLHLD